MFTKKKKQESLREFLEQGNEVILPQDIWNIIDKQTRGDDVITQTIQFIRDILEPQPGRYDRTYRYEHTLRVAAIGQQIAQEENLPEEPLIIACLLHDLGYILCTCFEDFCVHQIISEKIAREYLQKIEYFEYLDTICRAILFHNMKHQIPETATPFEISVMDADDIDRFDMMRLCEMGSRDVGEKSASEIIAQCKSRLEQIDQSENRPCGTKYAERRWKEQLHIRRDFYSRLLTQMQSTMNLLDK